MATQGSWQELVDRVLRPARPRLEDCVRAGEHHRATGQLAAEQRARALALCRTDIEAARAVVFAAGDGVISPHMTELEREWRRLSRADPDGGLMDLWARIAPASWVDRKRWRDSDAAAQLDAAVALASDVTGVEAAESALGVLRVSLAAWGTALGPRIRFRAFDADGDCVSDLLAAPERAAREALAKRDAGPIILERALQLERAVYEAARCRFPERPLLAQALAHAACVDSLLQTTASTERPNPVTPLCALWRTGYALAARDAASVTLEIPPLS